MDNTSVALLRRLRSLDALPSDADNAVDIKRKSPSFFEHIERQTEVEQSASYKLLIEEEPSIILEYNSLRALLKNVLSTPGIVDDATKLYLVHRVSDLARILTKKYDVYINEHPSFLTKRALHSHQESYERWLSLSSAPQKEVTKKSWLDSFLYLLMAEFTTDRMNPRRLYFLRERRLLLLLVPIIKDLGHYSSWILWADAYVAPFLTYLNLLFFLPRLVFNVYTLCDNTFNQSKLSPQSSNLGPLTRFMAQWNRLWPQLMNDIGWAISGALMCFVFVGCWASFGIYMSVGMQFYDVIMASVRVGIDLTRLNNLAENNRSSSLNADGRSEEDKHLLSLYLLHLEAAISREKSLLYLALANAAVLFIAVCLTLPVMAAISPWLPVVGAIIAIIMTVINFQGRSYLNTSDTPKSQTLEDLLEKDQKRRMSLKESQFSSSQFFLNKTLANSHYGRELKLASASPSPTGVATSHSLGYMVGDAVLI